MGSRSAMVDSSTPTVLTMREKSKRVLLMVRESMFHPISSTLVGLGKINSMETALRKGRVKTPIHLQDSMKEVTKSEELSLGTTENISVSLKKASLLERGSSQSLMEPIREIFLMESTMDRVSTAGTMGLSTKGAMNLE